MYELNMATAGFADLLFGAIGVWMAHSFYKTPRKKWQAVLAWVLVYIVWIVGSTPISWLMPDMSYERAAMIIGFTGIFVYLYLFPNIPVSQRIFTYFLVDTSQTLTVLFSRVLSTLAAQWFSWDVNVAFLCVYLPVTVGFIVVFRLWLRDQILISLKAFRTQLASLAVFAAVGYITLLLQVPTWEPWPAMTVWTAGGALGMIAFVLMGYVLAFRTLRSLLVKEAAENSARQLAGQIALSEQYYQTLLERVQQNRLRIHDMRHHVNTLSGLCADQNWEEVRRYVNDLLQEMPTPTGSVYSGNGALDALLGHYEGLCNENGITFRCQVHLPNLAQIEPLHLCVIIGNGLQNALEASEKLPAGAERQISVRAVTADDRIAISITNRYGGNLQTCADGTLTSTKPEPGHGLGLASIQETARRYHGWTGFSAENGCFTLNVMLPLHS